MTMFEFISMFRLMFCFYRLLVYFLWYRVSLWESIYSASAVTFLCDVLFSYLQFLCVKFFLLGSLNCICRPSLIQSFTFKLPFLDFDLFELSHCWHFGIFCQYLYLVLMHFFHREREITSLITIYCFWISFRRKKLDETTAELKKTSRLLEEEKHKTDQLLY